MSYNVIVPKQDAGLYERVKIVIAVCKAHQSEWELEDNHLSPLETAFAAWEPVFIKCRTPETPSFLWDCKDEWLTYY